MATTAHGRPTRRAAASAQPTHLPSTVQVELPTVDPAAIQSLLSSAVPTGVQSALASAFPSGLPTALPSGLASGNLNINLSDPNWQELYHDAINLSTCYFPGAFPIPLINSTTNKTAPCALGFYCPNNTDISPPQYCPPSPQCQVTRLSGGICGPQGKYEPVPCTKGYYCPPGGRQKIICPKGSFCPIGAYEPWPCGVGGHCPEGSIKRSDWYGAAVMLLLDAVLLAALIAGRMYKKRQQPRITTARHRYSMLPGKDTTVPATEKVAALEPPKPAGAHAHPWKRMVTRKAGVGGYRPKHPRPAFGAPVDEEGIGLMHLPRKGADEEEDEESAQDLKGLVDSFQRSIDGSQTGLSFAYDDLGLTLKTGRVLLAGVRGQIGRGEIWGIMGPSGAGKTTFMSVLMGKVDKTSGNLWVNGMKKNMKAFKRVIGYVPQDDIVLAELTVRENILHSARVRLPATWSEAQINVHVDQVIACLSLTHVQHSIVGDAAKRGISGGQRKRVNIGLELAAAPMALFLDEPTSGLDSTGALQVAKLLQSIAKLGVTVVSVIHQPRTEIFECLDNIALIASGRAVWQGHRVEMLEYFRKQGFVFNPKHNPADVMMDIISGKGFHHRDFIRENEVDFLINEWETQVPTLSTPVENPVESAQLQRSIKKRGAYWYKQVYLCFLRSLRQQHRNSSSAILEMCTACIAGGLMGFIVKSSDGHLFQSTYKGDMFIVFSSWINVTALPQIGLTAGMAIALAGSPAGVKVFGEEKLVYWREAAAGHNRAAYYTGKILSTVFRIFVVALHFTVFFTWLATPLIPLVTMYACVLLNFWCVYGMAHVVSMLVKKEDGPLLSVVVGLVVAVICGAGPSLRTVKEWNLTFLWRMSPATWFNEAIFTENVTPLDYLYDIDSAAQHTGYTLRQLGLDMLAMLLIGTVYRVVAFAGLVGLKRDKQR